MVKKLRSNVKKKTEQQKTAKERIRELFKQAKQAFKEDPKLSNRYMKLAKKMQAKELEKEAA